MNEINKLMDEIKEQCGDCEAWSGTDCTRNPYTQGCLKDEKKLTDEEKAIEELNNYRNRFYAEPQGTERAIIANAINNIFDLIHRLQSENERLTEERQSLVTKLNQTDEAVDYWCDKFKAEKAEKDELTDKLGKVLSTVGIDEYQQSKTVEQAVKDTAKEILQELWDETEPLNETHKWVRLRIKNIASRKSVEVQNG